MWSKLLYAQIKSSGAAEGSYLKEIKLLKTTNGEKYD